MQLHSSRKALNQVLLGVIQFLATCAMSDGDGMTDGWQESYEVMDGCGTDDTRLWTVVGRMMSFGR